MAFNVNENQKEINSYKIVYSYKILKLITKSLRSYCLSQNKKKNKKKSLAKYKICIKQYLIYGIFGLYLKKAIVKNTKRKAPAL